jgi:formate dehydrogenase major subunit
MKNCRVASYYHFVKAAIHFIISQGLENSIYLDDHCGNYEEYKNSILAEDYAALVKASGCRAETIAEFAFEYNEEQHSVMVFAEKNLSSATCTEIRNLTIITGKMGKTASGIIALREKNNSQGIFDMGGCSALAPGGKPFSDPKMQNILKETWKVDSLPSSVKGNQMDLLDDGKIKNMFIFGEDPLGTALNKDKVKAWFDGASFTVVQEYFMSETAESADLVLPASLPFETGGSFTNTQKFIQQFAKTFAGSSEPSSFAQLKALHEGFGLDASYETPADVMLEAASILQQIGPISYNRDLTVTTNNNSGKWFEHGCDYLGLMAEEQGI